jgi:energy-coupling factor transporter ATP-binding protein EcfA2
MKVDDKYYFDNDISDTVDAMMHRHKIKLDNLIVVTGREGSGKSSFAIGLCWLYAKRMGIKFDVDDITFSANEFLQRTTMRKNGIVLYDEAVQGLMSSQWQNKAQQLIIQALMMGRKNGNLYVVCIPSFEYLNKYIATERCYLLFDCFMHENRRGFAQMFSSKVPNQLKLLYHQCKSLSPTRMTSKWKIRFLDHSDKFIDKEAYEAKKDKAIQKLSQALQVDDVNEWQKKYYKLIVGCDLSTKEISDIMGIALRTAQDQKQKAKRYLQNG